MTEKQASIIQFHFLKQFTLRHRRKLKASMDELFQKEGFSLSTLDVIFCDDKYLLKINQDFLNHDDLTDIITFDLSADPSGKMGEIYISIERVKENALLYKTPFAAELVRVIFHGCLHLCGYKDKKPADIKIMRRKESIYLTRFLT